MTYEDLLELAQQGDPLIVAGCRVEMTDEGVIFYGYSDDTGYAVDLKVRVEGDLLHAWVREPDGDGQWTSVSTFVDYDDLVAWVYQF